MNLEWAHAAAAIIGALFGAAASIFTSGWRLGQIEGRLTSRFQESISASDKRFEDKMGQAINAFDETLKGLRQKINDVEKDTIKGYVAKPDFDRFLAEYRENERRHDAKLDRLLETRQ